MSLQNLTHLYNSSGDINGSLAEWTWKSSSLLLAKNEFNHSLLDSNTYFFDGETNVCEFWSHWKIATSFFFPSLLIIISEKTKIAFKNGVNFSLGLQSRRSWTRPFEVLMSIYLSCIYSLFICGKVSRSLFVKSLGVYL